MKKSARTNWKLQRYSAVLLIPLVTALLVKLIKTTHMSYDTIINSSINSSFFYVILIFAIIGLFHMRIGLNEILEDYVESDIATSILTKAISFLVIGILFFVFMSLTLILMSI